MLRRWGRFWSTSLAAAALLLTGHLARPLGAQEATRWPLCEGLVFSTEEDFVTQGPVPADGNRIISDGDLLALSAPDGATTVCARNAELLRRYQLKADLGLDAVDVIDAKDRIIAFSTELDHPAGAFTAGDLIFTSGGVLPNAALLAAFHPAPPRDMGLDGVHLIGKREALMALVKEVGSLPREAWLKDPERLPALLKRLEADIWFTTEGTEAPVTRPAFLDGDLLSARTGTIVASNSVLLAPPVPAGVPDRGVDFGLDAVTGSRDGKRESLLFSTEILYEDRRPGFTDGDVLRIGGGVVIPHVKLINSLEPKARFVGLDALHFTGWGDGTKDPNLQSLCGRGYPDLDFDGGRVPVGGAGTGLYYSGLGGGSGSPPRRPCGEYAAFDGYLPPSGVKRFRVAYRTDGAPAPAPGTASGIQTTWQTKTWQWFPFPGCYYNSALATTAAGWMDATDFLNARDGWPCTNPSLQFAVWDTKALPAAQKDGHFVVWLEWDDGATLHREPVEHHVQLDNTLPKIAGYPDGLQVRLLGGGPTGVVPACGEAPTGVKEFEVWGQFKDTYYSDFELRLRGGLPPASVNYGPHYYFDPTDGTPGIKNTDDTGTMPDTTTVHLRNIKMTDLGASFKDCCYVVDLWVKDAAIRHTFNSRIVNDNSGSSAYWDNAFVTFAAAP